MPRTQWPHLPDGLRALICEKAGHVHHEEPSKYGARSEISSTLHTDHGRVFVKGTRTDAPFIASLINEAAVNPYVDHLAPKLRWTIATHGWFVLGFQHVEGTHEFYVPGTAGLDAITRVIDELAKTACPPVVTKPAETVWRRYLPADELKLLAGDALLHTDLNPANLILAADRPYVVDWAWASRGAPWLDLAMLMPKLIDYGHSAEQAEAWASRFPVWESASPAGVNTFVRASLAQWASGSQGWMTAMYKATQQWADHRGITPC